VGGSLVDPKAIAAGDLAKIENLARKFVEIVRQTRGGG
jgi:2-keto-3-deoxy-6-phosphogluconate aldolase